MLIFPQTCFEAPKGLLGCFSTLLEHAPRTLLPVPHFFFHATDTSVLTNFRSACIMCHKAILLTIRTLVRMHSRETFSQTSTVNMGISLHFLQVSFDACIITIATGL